MTYGTPLTDAQVLDSAIAHLDSALARQRQRRTPATFIQQASLILKARILVDKGKFAAAAALVRHAPCRRTTSTCSATSPARNNDDLGIWQIVNSTARLTVSDSFEIVNGVPTSTKNALPFASANDPRVPVKRGQRGDAEGRRRGRHRRRMFVQLIWDRDDPIAMVVGHRRASDRGGSEAQRQRHRGHDDDPQRAARRAAEDRQLPAGGDGRRWRRRRRKDAATTLFFREKAFWTFGRGQRLNDMRRLMRQYGRTEDQVFRRAATSRAAPTATRFNFPVANERADESELHGLHRQQSVSSPAVDDSTNGPRHLARAVCLSVGAGHCERCAARAI